MHRIGLLCGALALAMFAAPSEAQQTAPDQPSTAPAKYQGLPTADQTQNSVPPAPPPDLQPTPGGPPPFPPMSKRPPQHRRVDMGGHHSGTHAGHRVAHASHKAKPKRHQLTRAEKDFRYCSSLSHRRMTHNRRCAAVMKKHKASQAHHKLTRTEKNARYCDSLSHRKMMHNRTCVALMKKQKAAKQRTAKHHQTPRHTRHHRRNKPVRATAY